MRCPQCNSENRDERAECYHCQQDLSMLRLVLNRAKNHYNNALEHADRDRNDEAIAELKHAVELDCTFTNAWVVLGTIYAKKEMFTEAKEAWRRALALDPRLEKAHNYLAKAESVSVSIPAVRRLQYLALGLFVALILASVGIVMTIRPDHAADNIQRALDLAGESRSGEAIATLEEAESLLTAPGESRRVAGFLKMQIEDKLRARAAEAALLAQNKNFSAARELMAAIEAEKPPQAILDEIAATQRIIDEAIIAEAQAAYTRFMNNPTPKEFADFNAVIAKYAEASGEGASQSRVNKLAADAKAEFERKEVADRRIQISSEPDIAKAALLAEEAAKEFPAAAEEFHKLVTARLEGQAQINARDLETALFERNLSKARALLNDTKNLYDAARTAPPKSLIGSMEQSIRAIEGDLEFGNLQQAREAQNWAAILDATADLEASGFNDRQREDLKIWRAEALSKTAVENQKWMMEQDVRIAGLNISPEEARRILDTYRIVVEHHPAPRMFSQKMILFYAGMAALRLDQPAEANKLFDEAIEGTGPRHDARRAVDRARKRFAERLGAQ
jgi:hypothetical protein